MMAFRFMRAWTRDSCQVHSNYTKKIVFFVLQETQWCMLQVANMMPHPHVERVIGKAPEAMNETVDSLFMEVQTK